MPEVACCRTARRHGCDVDRPRRRRSRKPAGWFIQALTAITISEPVKPVITIGMPLSEVRARRQPVPAVDVDPDEDRLEEEREALDREAEAEHAAERGGEVRPQQPHLEAEDRAGDHADGEQRDHHPRPAPRERAVQRVAGAQVQPLDEQHHRRERDPEARPAGCARRTTAPASGAPRSRYSCCTGPSACASVTSEGVTTRRAYFSSRADVSVPVADDVLQRLAGRVAAHLLARQAPRRAFGARRVARAVRADRSRPGRPTAGARAAAARARRRRAPRGCARAAARRPARRCRSSAPRPALT